MPDAHSNVSLSAQARLWLGEAGPGPQTRLFRRVFDVSAAPAAAELLIYAEACYNVWVNGRYVGRGPIFHHPTRLEYDRYDVVPHLKAGTNVIAVLVHTPNVALHNAVLSGEPGLVVDLAIADSDGSTIHVSGDSSWRCTDQTGWRDDTPRRGWAIGYVECFDASAAPLGWQEVDFDDSRWPAAEVHRPATSVAEAEFVAREVPPLRYAMVAPQSVIGIFSIADPPVPLTAAGPNLAAQIMQARWTPPPNGLSVRGGLDSPEGLEISGLDSQRGAMVCFDLGDEYVGQIVLECDCPGRGVIDVGWSEVIEDHRPVLIRKGMSYVDRILASPGRVSWQAINFTGLRYLAIRLGDFTGPVTLRRVGVQTSAPDVSWPASFSCCDDRLNRIWRMCQRSLCVATQDSMMDCPTREQAPYVGDGHLAGRWFAQLTGDSRHWRYLVHEQFRRQSPGGLVRGSVFSGCSDTLIDYSLLAVIGTRDYWRFSGDLPTVRTLVDNCRRALGWFTSRLDERGIFISNWTPPSNLRRWEQPYDPAWPTFDEEGSRNLFIDHPGMGWHNIHEAGLDRRGTNAAINALIVLARRALADLEEAAGCAAEANDLRNQADALALRIGELIFDPDRQVFVDGILDGRQLSQISEQTNTWAIAAGCCDRPTAAAILRKLLTSTDPQIARNGPYFWAYLFPVLADLGLADLGLEATRKLWGRMIDGGASTLWETFNGDDKDTWCHPWSAAPVEFLLATILGLSGLGDSRQSVCLRPRYDLLPEASGAMVTPVGLVSIRWSTAEGLSGTLPDGVAATVHDPTGAALGQVRGQWSLRLKV